MLRFAYNTNGLQSHRLEDALPWLAEEGYEGVALTLDHMHLDPLKASPGEVAAVGRLLRRCGLACAVETGARYVLDPRRKHWPSLGERDPLAREQRIDHLRRCVEIAGELGAEVVTFAAGVVGEGGAPAEDAWWFVRDGVERVVKVAEEAGVAVSLEPEPGHWVATLAQWERMTEGLEEVGLTLDISHVSVEEPEGTAAEAVERYAGRLLGVHVEDAPAGVHQHLPFGEGELDVAGVLGALERVGYGGLVSVELSRHGHCAHRLVPESLAYLRARSG